MKFSNNMANDLDIPIIGDVRLLPIKCVALSKHPHIHDRVKALWGFEEFFHYVDSLLYLGRESRDGFDHEVYFELALLRRTFEKRWEEIINPFMSTVERQRIVDFLTPKDAVKAALKQ